MELQTYHFFFFFFYSTINFASVYEPDVLNSFCATRVLKSKFYKEYKRSLARLSPRNFAAIFNDISLNITPKELKLQPCFKFH